MSKPLRMTPLMRRYYERWLNTPTLLENPHDEDKFYQFVKACIRYGHKSRSGSWLRGFLEKDIKGLFHEDHAQYLISKAVSIFDHIVEYENVAFPDPMVELRDPTSVRTAMRSATNANGERFYTDQEIQAFIEQRFK